MIKFHQNAWLKPYIDKNTDVRKKKDLEKDLMNKKIKYLQKKESTFIVLKRNYEEFIRNNKCNNIIKR